MYGFGSKAIYSVIDTSTDYTFIAKNFFDDFIQKLEYHVLDKSLYIRKSSGLLMPSKCSPRMFPTVSFQLDE